MLYSLSFEFCSSKIMVDEWFTYATNTCTTEPLLWDTSIQETPQSRGHNIWSLKNIHTIFVFVMSIEGTLPLFRGKRHFFWVLKPGFNFHSGETLAIKLWLTIKVIDKFKCSLLQKWQLSWSKRELTHLNWCTALVGSQHLTLKTYR